MNYDISQFEYKGNEIFFAITNPKEHIQKFHAKKLFYELEELEMIEQYVAPNSRILEVGANIGNHVVYYDKIMNANTIICVEPNKEAYDILNINIELNEIKSVDSLFLGIGLSDKFGTAVIERPWPMNVGGARMKDSSDGNLLLYRGDLLFENMTFDFIKLDTEVQDIEALKGLRNTINRSRPLIFVEIFDSRYDEFTLFLKEINYRVLEKRKIYKLNSNYLIQPA